jgi:uncharacterized protein YvpB
MIAAYFINQPPDGYQDWEEYFVKNLPINCNPHKGFRRLINGVLGTECHGSYGYVVYAEPLKDLFSQIGLHTDVRYGMTYEELASEVKSGNPVIVWISWKDKNQHPVIHKIDENII